MAEIVALMIVMVNRQLTHTVVQRFFLLMVFAVGDAFSNTVMCSRELMKDRETLRY